MKSESLYRIGSIDLSEVRGNAVDRAQDLPRPVLGCGEAQALAARLFGMTGGIKELGSQQDRNFRLTGPDGQIRLLKISNPAFSLSELEAQNQAMEHLQAQGLAVPVPVPSPPCGSGDPAK